VLFFAEITIFRFLSKFADGVREVLVVYDQKGKDLTLNDIKHAYSKGRSLVNMPSGK
jgi:cation-transporting ATPase E